MKKALIIGGGFAGCSTAHLLELKGGWEVTLVEKNSFLGGGVRTQRYGGHPYTYGPRHFLTEKEELYEYLNSYCPMEDCSQLEYLTYVEQDGAYYNFPINKKDIEKMPDREKINTELDSAELKKAEIRFSPSGELMEGSVALPKNLEDFWIQSVGNTLYEKFVKYYTQKMWLVNDNKSIDSFGWSPKGVTLKDGSREGWGDAISAYPLAENGYNDYFDLATKNAKVLLNTEIEVFDIPNKSVKILGEKRKFDIIVNTISPDIVMNNTHGELPYIGRDLVKFVIPVNHALPGETVFLYHAGKESFTRIVEYKKLTRQNWDSPTTLLSMEFPSKNGRYYPLPFKSEMERAKKYFNDMPDGVFSIGRAGSYDYGVDIDDVIEQAMDICKSL